MQVVCGDLILLLPSRHGIAPMAFSSAVLPQASALVIPHHILSGLAVTALHGVCWELPVHRSAHGQGSRACPYNLNSVKIHRKSDARRSHTAPPAVQCDGAACPNLSEHTAGPARVLLGEQEGNSPFKPFPQWAAITGSLPSSASLSRLSHN